MKRTGRTALRRSRYDRLLDAGDEVVVLERGVDFPAAKPIIEVQRYLYRWARSRGVRVETSASWEDPRTGAEIPESERGPEAPGLEVRVVGNRGGKGRARL